jgi:DNA-binding NtrC family response regulator
MEMPLRLVLIDDDQGVLRALGLLLQAMKFEVTTFASPHEGIEYAASSSSVDLVVTDLRMPLLSGEDVVREVRRRNPTLPIVVMSGHATSTDIASLQALGMNAFLPKPFTPDQILSIVRTLFGSTVRRVDAA